MKVTLITITIILLLTQNNLINAQQFVGGFLENSKTNNTFLPFENKNSFQGSVGTTGLDISFSAIYERIIAEGGKRKQFKPVFRMGLCIYTAPDNFDQIGVVQSGLIFGGKNHHLDFLLGFGFTQIDDIRRNTFAAISFAYRYQKPHGKLFFRAGVGMPEGIFVGGGIAF